MNRIIFNPITTQDFVNKVISNEFTDLAEMGFYIITNDCFFNVIECNLKAGEITVRNTIYNVDCDIELEEIGYLWQMEHPENFFNEE